jgi:cation-transporting ATPase E
VATDVGTGRAGTGDPVGGGLSEAEAAALARAGQANLVPAAPSRTFAQILRANLLTPFNALLGGLLVVILIVGPLQDALFGLVLIANAATGIVQELRAKRTLDRLAVLNAPRATVVRDGVARTVPVGEVVLGDMLELGPGDQVVVDGEVLASAGLEADESLLTGESDPVAKQPGAELLSGSFVAAGGGRYRATRVGPKAYAAALAEEARRFSLASSELRTGINRVIKLVGWAMLPTAGLLVFSQLRAHAGLADAVSATVAGVVAMVPEGLVLLTTIAFAIGVVRLGRRHALVQELAAVETLARVDVLCLDKTGTITRGDIAVDAVEPLGEDDDDVPHRALAALAAADPHPNATLLAIAKLFDGTGRDGSSLAERKAEGSLAERKARWVPTRTMPFSSARKWSGADFGQRGSWLLGAPEVLLPFADADGARQIGARAEAHAVLGRRVVLLASSAQLLDGDRPPPLSPRALVILSDQVRPEAPRTLRWFAEQGVAVKVISGDHPRTVAAVAARAGLATDDAARTVDARTLPEEPGALAAALEAGTVFGRVTPRQKRAMVEALQGAGHVVAMTGDGVNDVLALKDADIGVAMGSGSSASRAVAEIVLLDSSFATLPAVVGEGRRVINNIERVAKLFLTKTVYSMLLALAVGVAGLPFPFLPRHLTLVGSLTIGIPAFFLALVPNTHLARPGFVSRVLRFAVPAGVIAASATFGGYALAYLGAMPDVSVAEAKTTATMVLLAFGLVVLARLAMPMTPLRVLLIGVMTAAFALVLLVPFGRAFFDLDPPPLPMAAAGAAIVGAAALLLDLAGRLATRETASG